MEALLSNEKVLDIQTLSFDKSPTKPSASKPSTSKASPSKPIGVRTFFGKKLKSCTNNAFKPLGVVEVSTQKLSSSDHVSKLNLVYSLCDSTINI